SHSLIRQQRGSLPTAPTADRLLLLVRSSAPRQEATVIHKISWFVGINKRRLYHSSGMERPQTTVAEIKADAARKSIDCIVCSMELKDAPAASR
ncbi:hypothetical protein SB719_18955, partial [Pantoea sp. SIMBA_079]|uniref:hypothetical protein n=1 Tax=Pantoea sp. SIMBA_079 TaxID=3085817 RepID=UPI0039965F77